LEICQSYWEKTFGYFDITASSKRPGFKNVTVDFTTRKISFADPTTQLDFGAFGKGYALDCAARILKENGVQNALLHGGTSSVLAIGDAVKVGLRNPWSDAADIEDILLCNEGLSSSATFHNGQSISDIVDPHRHVLLREEAACVVIGATALEAEIFSTALLSMGKERAEKFCSETLPQNLRVLWMDKINGEPRLQWLPKLL
jgi:FAD:protein FMN transferase